MRMIYRTQILIAICLLLGGSITQRGKAATSTYRYQEQPAAEWQRYTVSGEEFSVLLPVPPAMSTSDVFIDPNNSRRERILGAYSKGAVYAVYTFEKKSLTLDDLILEFATKNGLPRLTQPVTVQGFAGVSLRGETDDRTVAMQLFATAKSLYVFQVVGSKPGDSTTGLSTFLSSIRFSKQPEGIQAADGAGEQPAENPDLASSIFSSKNVTRKVSVITKPEPRYTEEARKNQITGTVVLRAVFTSSGAVTKIAAVSKLPDGLTDQAIGAAKQIRFIPAIKDGRFVSMWIELQYNFNLY
jgi:TonB family protein